MAAVGTKENPWKLKTPPLTSDREMYKDVKDGKEVIMCIVGKTTLIYDAKCQVVITGHQQWRVCGLFSTSSRRSILPIVIMKYPRIPTLLIPANVMRKPKKTN